MNEKMSNYGDILLNHLTTYNMSTSDDRQS